ncbi:hypothetical protein PLICRDRAFT_48278 [Plicaturopsis crispa FD-325 SS-3]|nr:hypothetical protein PLICRDRAFT_48278 [Plicaturopsis crispa FD-325 SS-3]
MDPVSLQSSLQDALDILASSRASSTHKSHALTALEHILALACVPSESSDTLGVFLSLQDTFECNVPSRLLSWISLSTIQLETYASKGLTDDRESDAYKLATQLIQSLSLIQGVVLNHKPSKRYLGRQYALEVLLDLLLASRHLSTSAFPSQAPAGTTPTPPPPLSAAVLDTLLCVLVDSCSALRAFEDALGVQAVVKILKRAGTPREVRMKCLEFLYFYLLDETPASASAPPSEPTLEPEVDTQPPPSPHPIPVPPPFPKTAPNTPLKAHRSIGLGMPTPRRGSQQTSSGSGSTTSRSSSGSRSGQSTASASTSASTPPASLPSRPTSPVKRSSPFAPRPKTPPQSSLPPLQHKTPAHLRILQRDVDFVPLSPVKASNSSKARGVSKESSASSILAIGDGRTRGPRTTQEKKDLLGGMLGNVDALVEGVRKAGVWGLG